MINDLTSPVERGPIIDVNQQDVNLSCASHLTGSGSGEGACVRWVSLIDHSMPDFVVALEGDGIFPNIVIGEVKTYLFKNFSEVLPNGI